MLASCGDDLRVTDWKTLRCVRHYEPPHLFDRADEAVFKKVTFNSDGRNIMAIPYEGRCLLFDVDDTDGDSLIPKELLHATSSGQFSRTAPYEFLFGTLDGYIHKHDISTDLSTLIKHMGEPVDYLDIGVTGACMGGCANGSILLMKPNSESSLSFTVLNSGYTTVLGTSLSYPHLMASGTSDGRVSIWDINAPALLMTQDQHRDDVLGLAFSPSHQVVATVGRDSILNFFDIRMSELLIYSKELKAVDATCMTYDPSGDNLVLGTRTGCIACFDHRNMAKILSAFPQHKSHVASIVFCQTVGPVCTPCNYKEDLYDLYFPSNYMDLVELVVREPDAFELNMVEETDSESDLSQLAEARCRVKVSDHDLETEMRVVVKEITDRSRQMLDAAGAELLRNQLEVARRFVNLEAGNKERREELEACAEEVARNDEQQLADVLGVVAFMTDRESYAKMRGRERIAVHHQACGPSPTLSSDSGVNCNSVAEIRSSSIISDGVSLVVNVDSQESLVDPSTLHVYQYQKRDPWKDSETDDTSHTPISPHHI